MLLNGAGDGYDEFSNSRCLCMTSSGVAYMSPTFIENLGLIRYSNSGRGTGLGKGTRDFKETCPGQG